MTCGLLGCPSFDEVARSTSPDGQVDAVLVEVNGGATTSFGYRIHVLPKGKAPSDESEAASLYGAARSESAYGANLHWRSGSALVVEYLTARSAELKHPTTSVGGEEITVELVAGIPDPNAPPGGMLYNLEGRPDDPAH